MPSHTKSERAKNKKRKNDSGQSKLQHRSSARGKKKRK